MINVIELNFPQHYLSSTPYLNFDSPIVNDFVTKYRGVGSTTQQAINLYYAVRDKISYNPYYINLSVVGLCASECIKSKRGWCVNKAVVYAACCRMIGVPAVLGYADVKNHITIEKLRKSMNSDIFYWHSYTMIYLNDKWVKATPAFNQRLCNKFGIVASDFNGVDDSIFMPLNQAGDKHMEYLNYRGEFADVPLQDILVTYREKYPSFNVDNTKK